MINHPARTTAQRPTPATHPGAHRVAPTTGLRRVAAAAAGLIAATGMVWFATPAMALPPGGADPDTPGTSASVSPRTVEQCGTLTYEVSGYPAGEILNIKVDDGAGYSDQSVHGSGVLASQKISSDGTASGSVTIDCTTTPGDHWLRFLASQEKYDANGEVLGTIGFTRAGGGEFTVVKKKEAASPGDASDNSERQSDGNKKKASPAAGGGATRSGGNDTASDIDTFRSYLETLQGGGPASAGGASPQQRQATTGGGHTGGGHSPEQHQASAHNTGHDRPAHRAQQAPAAAEPLTQTSVVIVEEPDTAADDSAEPTITGGDGSGVATLALGEGDAHTTDAADSAENTGAAPTGADATKPANAPAASAAQPRSTAAASTAPGAPIIGLLVGGAILLVGIMGTGAYLWVNTKGRRS